MCHYLAICSSVTVFLYRQLTPLWCHSTPFTIVRTLCGRSIRISLSSPISPTDGRTDDQLAVQCARARGAIICHPSASLSVGLSPYALPRPARCAADPARGYLWIYQGCFPSFPLLSPSSAIYLITDATFKTTQGVKGRLVVGRGPPPLQTAPSHPVGTSCRMFSTISGRAAAI